LRLIARVFLSSIVSKASASSTCTRIPTDKFVEISQLLEFPDLYDCGKIFSENTVLIAYINVLELN
jgi:hypothetical protein